MRVAALIALFIVGLLVIGAAAFVLGQRAVKTITITQFSTITQSPQASDSSSTSVTSIHCARTGEGWAFYVHVVADGTGKPLQGAEIKASGSTSCLPSSNSTVSVTDTSVVVSATSPENGTISLPTSVDKYSISVTYQGVSFSIAQVDIPPVQITNVTMRFPSGNISITHSLPPH